MFFHVINDNRNSAELQQHITNNDQLNKEGHVTNLENVLPNQDLS